MTSNTFYSTYIDVVGAVDEVHILQPTQLLGGAEVTPAAVVLNNLNRLVPLPAATATVGRDRKNTRSDTLDLSSKIDVFRNVAVGRFE